LNNLQVLSLQSEKPPTDELFFALPGGLTGDLPPFHSAPNLRELYLSHNALQGSIPENFLDSVNDKDAVIHVDLHKNNIKGSVPTSLSDFSNLQLDVADNYISMLLSFQLILFQMISHFL